MRASPFLFSLFIFVALSAASASAESTVSGDLPRAGDAPLEVIDGLDSHYGVLETRDGSRLRTVLTRPSGSRGRLPAILFVQWLSCDSIELPASQTDGWSRMLRRVARDSGAVMMRTEKAGVGDSAGGSCAELDYETELDHHRDALAALRRSEQVDPERIVIFGASMGGNMAPLMAEGQDVAGIMIWGGGAHTWFERTLGFERRAKELEGMPAAELDRYLKRLVRFLKGYLLDSRAPEVIVEGEPELEAVWAQIVGTGEGTHYGRPLAFHQQAQAQNWPAAWAAVQAPVLVVYGEYDWFESADAHRLVADLVNRNRAGQGQYVVIPATDHHFMRYPDRLAAFREEGGTVNADAAAGEMLRWLREVMK